MASTWGGLAEAIERRSEPGAAVGARQGLAPVLDVTRDPRWGRTEETFGEDPHLVASMGAAFVRGLQGADLSSGVVATAKHFVGYGASEGGLNWAPAHIPPRELHDVYLHPFRAAVDAAPVMPSYQSRRPTAPTGSEQGLLRDEAEARSCDYFRPLRPTTGSPPMGVGGRPALETDRRRAARPTAGERCSRPLSEGLVTRSWSPGRLRAPSSSPVEALRRRGADSPPAIRSWPGTSPARASSC